jgi:uncharacterized protein YdaU (DUF1376 family)
MNFYPFHIGDYASHTRHLSLIEDLVYRRLIDAYYLAEKPFLGEYSLIARSIGMRDYLDEVEYILTTFFEKAPNGWINKRCDDEITKYKAKADSARNANRVKLEKLSTLKSELKTEPVQLPTNNQEPITKNHIKTIAPPEGVDLSLWHDYLKVRKAAKKPLTETALKGLIREAEKAKISLSDALQTCCERSWVGFKAEWIAKSAVTQDKPTQRWDANIDSIVAKGKELGILPKPGETEGQYRERVRMGRA